MIINKIQINGFGKLKEKNIEFDSKVNVITGKNESGKSTILEFIKAIFYGINKNKAGKNFSDLEKFKPWDDIDFSGKVFYEIEGKKYSAFRDFNKNTCKVFDEESNDITKDFNVDKSRGAEFGIIHLGIDESTFESSGFTRQANIKVEDESQKVIVQKLTNMINSGEEDVSYEKLINKLDIILRDEVGTQRTANKPRNIVLKEIQENEQLKSNLINNRKRHDEITQQITILRNKIDENASVLEVLKKVYEIKDRCERKLREERNAIDSADKLIKQERDSRISKEKAQQVKNKVIVSILTIIAVIVLILLQKYFWTLPVFVIALILFLFNSKKIEQSISNSNNKINELEEKYKSEEYESIKILGKVDLHLLDMNSEKLKESIAEVDKNQNTYILEEHKLKLEDETLRKGLNNLTEVEEMLVLAYEKKEKLDKIESAVNLGIDILEEAYNEIKKEVIPDIEIRIKECIKQTTNGEYIDVVYNDRLGLIVQNTKGDMITIDKLSVGTIDQMYLGFRLAVLGKLGEVPLLLDETFAYFDDERLENMMRTIISLSNQNQVIIFSCSNREIDMLNKIGTEYNHITM
jgi:DNA repair exonuclease SbcCD ATPase subunit